MKRYLKLKIWRRELALALLCVAQFVVVLDVTIVAIALPEIQDSLGFSQAGVQWVVSAYTLVFGGFLMLAGRTADLYGRRKLFAIGLALFSTASLTCGLATSPLWLISARIVQGLGAAVVSPSALSILTTTFPEGNGRERAVGVWTAAAAGGGAAGWLLGGVISQGLGWAWIFFVNVPIGLLGLVLIPFLIEDSRDTSASTRLDALGAVTATAGLSLLVYGLTQAGEAGFASLRTLGALGLSIVLLAIFLLTESRSQAPLVPLHVFGSRQLTGANLAALAITAATTPPMLLCIFYAQRVADLTPAEAGLLFPPFNLAVIAGSLFSSRIVKKTGVRVAMLCGFLGIAAGILFLNGVTPEGDYLAHLLPGFLLMGSGLGLASMSSTVSGTSAVNRDRQGLASGLLNSFAQVGTSLGLATLVPLSAARTEILTAHGTTPEEALVTGFKWAFSGAILIAILGIFVAVLLISDRKR